MTYPLDKVIRPLNNWGLVDKPVLTSSRLHFLFCLFQLLFLAVSFGLICSSIQISCSDFDQKPRKILKRLRRNFLFVEKPTFLRSSQGIPRGVGRDVTKQMLGTTKRPWSWAQDDNPDRVPRFMTKAVCPRCARYCRALLYYYRGLVQRCDVRIGQTVWKWILVELPVAYVYDP